MVWPVTQPFFEAMHRALKPGGVICTQARHCLLVPAQCLTMAHWPKYSDKDGAGFLRHSQQQQEIALLFILV